MKDSKCHLDAATMDSPASVNFYDNHDIEKQLTVIKQEPFDSDETHGAGGLGLGDFLNSEESVDLWAYLDRYEHQGANNAQLSTPNTVTDQRHQRLNTLPPAPSAQQSDSSTHTRHTSGPAAAGPIHYENLTQLHQVNSSMPLNTPHTHSQNIGDQADSIVPDLMQYIDIVQQQGQGPGPGMEIEVETMVDLNSANTSTCSSVASSPGRPMSSDMQASTPNSPGGGVGKKRRNNPPPGTHEYVEKRQRNNVAVRKCRQKTKEKNKELQNKVGELQGENANLKKRVEMLTKELTVLKSLFTNVHKPAPARLEKVNL